MSNAELVLEFKEVTRSYRQGDGELKVLDGASFSLKKGECVALVGPSGSGKSTLLQIAGLLDRPDSGEVLIAGKSMGMAADSVRTACRRDRLGFVYQFHHLLPEFTALENVMVPQIIAGVKKRDAKKRAKELLEAFGLSERLEHYPSMLSGGEQQRVAIARAFANRPGVLLADEPTGNLDHHTADHVVALFLEQVRGHEMGLLLVTHDLELAKKMDRVMTLADGRV